MSIPSIDQDLEFLTSLSASQSSYWFERFCSLQNVSNATAKTCLAKTSFYSGRWRLSKKDVDLPSRFRDILNEILKMSRRRPLRTVIEDGGRLAILGTGLPSNQDVVTVGRIDDEVSYDARECFQRQNFRRFVYGFTLSRTDLCLFFFDRNGILKSTPLNIHQDAVMFVRLILALSGDLVPLGFDPALEHLDGKIYITVAKTRYLVERVMFRRREIVCRGTVCWLVQDEGSGEKMLIKDIWREAHRDPEHELLLPAQVIDGVVKLLAIGESIIDARSEHGLPPGARTFCRMVLELGGPTIQHFKSGLQLLQTLRDAVATHYELVKIGILHRDISVNNILLKSHGRATIIDMDLATRVHRGKTPTEKAIPTGTPVFRPAKQRHDFLDDLESFLYVYMWIVMSQDGPGTTNRISVKAKFLKARRRFMRGDSSMNIAPYFNSPPYVDLLEALRDLVQRYSSREDVFDDFDAIYAAYLGHVDRAIERSGSRRRSASCDVEKPAKRARTSLV